MPTITIDLPDNVNLRDARTFMLEKLYEAGFLASEQNVGEPAGEKEQFRENRERLEEEFAKTPLPLSREEFLQLVLNGPVANEETIRRQDEVREHIKQWKMPW